jgi:O-antigen ligase
MIYLKRWLKNNCLGLKGILLAITIYLITLPLAKLGYNNLALGILILSLFINRKYITFNRNKALYLPIIFYLFLVLSLFWTINSKESTKALSKEITLFIVPIVFLFIPKFSKADVRRVLKNFSYAMSIYSTGILINAAYRYVKTKNIDVFFYHELVTLNVNAIYISAISSIGLLFLIHNNLKKWWDYLAAIILAITIILLSSKNIIVITILLSTLSFIVFKKKQKHAYTLLAITILILAAFSSKILSRFQTEANAFNEEIIFSNGIKNVSITEALYQDQFSNNNYFSGTSLRIYQARLLSEFIQEDHIFWTGYGINASQNKIKDKQIERGYVDYFGTLNFHNQYIQNFAEIGFIGFLLFIVIILNSIYVAIKNKDFNFLCYALLIGSLCITESIFARQRGVAIFIIFYCIYHHQNKKEHTT